MTAKESTAEIFVPLYGKYKDSPDHILFCHHTF